MPNYGPPSVWIVSGILGDIRGSSRPRLFLRSVSITSQCRQNFGFFGGRLVRQMPDSYVRGPGTVDACHAPHVNNVISVFKFNPFLTK